MKKITTLLFLNIVFFAAAWTQNSFSITGTIKGLSEGKVHLKEFRTDEKVKKYEADIKNGKFFIEGTVESPCIVYLSINDETRKPYAFFIENSKIDIQITVSENDKTFVVRGSNTNEEYANLTKKCNKLLEGPEEEKEYAECLKELVHNNNNSIFSPQIIQSYLVYVLEYEELKEIISVLEGEATKTYPYQQLQKRLKELETVSVGQPAPYLQLPNQDGKMISFKELLQENKYVLIDFWASWCGPCRKENPTIVKAHQSFHEKGFDIFAVSFDKDKEKWLNAIKQDGLTWTHVSELKMWDNEAAKLYRVNSIPSNVLINKDGIIIARNLHGDELLKKLEELFSSKSLKQVYEINH